MAESDGGRPGDDGSRAARPDEVLDGAQDAVRGSMFVAKGDRGQLTIINPVAPHQSNQITLKTADGAKE